MKRFHESISRSLAKTISFRVLIVILDLIIIYIFTRRLDITIGLTVVGNLLKTVIYFFHERAWNQVHWGKHHKKK